MALYEASTATVSLFLYISVCAPRQCICPLCLRAIWSTVGQDIAFFALSPQNAQFTGKNTLLRFAVPNGLSWAPLGSGWSGILKRADAYVRGRPGMGSRALGVPVASLSPGHLANILHQQRSVQVVCPARYFRILPTRTHRLAWFARQLQPRDTVAAMPRTRDEGKPAPPETSAN